MHAELPEMMKPGCSCRSMTTSADRYSLLLGELKLLRKAAQAEQQGSRDPAVLHSYAVEMQGVPAELTRLWGLAGECHSALPLSAMTKEFSILCLIIVIAH